MKAVWNVVKLVLIAPFVLPFCAYYEWKVNRLISLLRADEGQDIMNLHSHDCYRVKAEALAAQEVQLDFTNSTAITRVLKQVGISVEFAANILLWKLEEKTKPGVRFGRGRRGPSDTDLIGRYFLTIGALGSAMSEALRTRMLEQVEGFTQYGAGVVDQPAMQARRRLQACS